MPGKPYGSPSSRLPRNPMCPLDNANSDSDCESKFRLSLVSRTCHGSTGKASSVIIGNHALQQLGEVGYHNVGAVAA